MIKKKTCSVCDVTKFIDEFYDDKRNKDSKREICKKCNSERSKRYYQKHKKERLEYGRKYKEEHKEEASVQNKIWYENGGRERRGHKSMYEDKTSPQYLGIVIGERLCRHLFKDVEMMPYGNPKFDFICNKGMKIDVKTACLTKNKYPYWGFTIDRNTTADYFICVAFDNRTLLNPLYLWMIPGNEINHLTGISIYLSTLHKWNKWERDIKDAQLCCAELKESQS